VQLLGDENKFRKKAAVSLNEAFKMYKNTEEDLTVYKDCFLDLLGDDTTKILKAINKQITIILNNYINLQNSNPKSPKSENDKKDVENPFMAAAAQEQLLKKIPMKKRQTILITQMKDEFSDEAKSV